MSIVNLVSGGLDSTLISVLMREEGIDIFPLFIDYGQKAARSEWVACKELHKKLELPDPVRMDIAGFGHVIHSGLTAMEKDVKLDAFTPGRNLLFLIMASSYAFQVGASAISIGLLNEKYSLFPDQMQEFVRSAERTIKLALGRSVGIVTPLSDFSKNDVVILARERGITGTYSCHSGQSVPCGKCISCLELQGGNN